MTVKELGDRMTAPEMDEWALYFEDNPSENGMSSRVEMMLARFATGFFKGDTEDFLLLSDRQRTEIQSAKLRKHFNGK